MHSFLLVGQSNMAGRGFMEEAHNIDVSRIFTLRNGRWQQMFRPINPDRSFSGVNLAESFAEAYAKKYDVNVGLICCADGGTSLEQWKPDDVLFENAIHQAKLAMRSSEIVGILWHQGENDCCETSYPTYKERLEDLIKAFRQALGNKNLPFLLGGLGDFLAVCDEDESLKNYIYINDALKDIAQNNDNTEFISAEGLNANPDNLHFNSEALYEFGIRYFEGLEKLGINLSKENIEEDIKRSKIELL